MLKGFVNLTEKLTGFLLGSFAVSVQLANVLICIVLIVAGPAAILWPQGQ